MTGYKFSFWILLAVLVTHFLLLPFFSVNCAFSATSIDILDRQRGQELPESLSKPQIRISEDGIMQGMSESTPFNLNSLTIEGFTAFSEADLLAPYRDLIGKKISFLRRSVIAAALTKKYRDAGYLLARVIIPEQAVDENGANFPLLVIEGYIESIEYVGDKGIQERFRSYFGPIQHRIVGEKPLSHKQFERYMLLMQDLPGMKIASRFKRGEKPGAPVLVIDVGYRLVNGGITYGNTGMESAGPFIGTATASLNTLPVIGAQTTVSYSQANNYKEYWTVKVVERYQMWNGLTFTGSWSRSDSPEMDTQFARDFDYRSDSDIFNKYRCLISQNQKLGKEILFTLDKTNASSF